MKSIFICLLFAAFVARGQELVTVGNGSYRAFQDGHGRYVRLEGSDGVIVNYLYDSPSATAESGVAIRVAGGVTLTVRYDQQGGLWTAGMPRLRVISNAEERASEIRADGASIATFEYRDDKYVGAVSVPGNFTLRLTPPDARHRVLQTLVDAKGRILHQTDVVSSTDGVGIWSGDSFESVAQGLGFDPRSLRYQNSPAGYLNTGRDANGRAALYLVTAGRQSVGFTPDGIPRFYDLAVDIFDSEIPSGSDAGTSVSLQQSKAMPAHVTLTAGGMPGVYIEEPANGAIYAAWVERDSSGKTVTKYARATATDKP